MQRSVSSSRWLRRLPLFGVVVVTVIFTLGPDVVGPSNLLDAFAHAGAYAALTVAALIWPSRRPLTPLTAFARAIVVLAFGVAMEEAQRLVGRDAQIGDVGANALGTLAGLIIAWLGRAALRRRFAKTS